MNLFLNAILESGVIILFNDKKEIINEKEIKTLWNESEKLLSFLDDFLNENRLDYKDIQNIVVVAGPGSFTWIRTISLLVNTINFVTKNSITDINFFDLYNTYPIIKSSSKRDSFFKKDENWEIEIIKNEELLNYLKSNNISKIYWENNNLFLTEGFSSLNEGLDIQIFDNIDYSAIIKNIHLKQEKRIEPIYIKKPSIS
jgi:tRNA A37 threonylcarbamoyladenosine modification protein TsaB